MKRQLSREIGISTGCIHEMMVNNDLDFETAVDILLETKDRIGIPREKIISGLPVCIIDGRTYRTVQEVACEFHLSTNAIANYKNKSGYTGMLETLCAMQEETKECYVVDGAAKTCNELLKMGYTKNEKGELVIVPEEAEIVQTVFRLYLEGYSAAKISEYLQEKGIRTTTGKEKWHATVVMKMLRNEKYMGDALLQKTYTVDFMTKKKVINNGIVPQYYVEDDHEAIIPKELFFRVQEEIMRRSSMCKSAVTRKKNQKSRYSSGYALTGILLCGKCG